MSYSLTFGVNNPKRQSSITDKAASYQEARKLAELWLSKDFMGEGHDHEHTNDAKGRPIEVAYLVTVLTTYESLLHQAAIIAIMGDFARSTGINASIAQAQAVHRQDGIEVTVKGRDDEDGRVALLRATLEDCGCYVEKTIDYHSLQMPETAWSKKEQTRVEDRIEAKQKEAIAKLDFEVTKQLVSGSNEVLKERFNKWGL